MDAIKGKTYLDLECRIFMFPSSLFESSDFLQTSKTHRFVSQSVPTEPIVHIIFALLCFVLLYICTIVHITIAYSRVLLRFW